MAIGKIERVGTDVHVVIEGVLAPEDVLGIRDLVRSARTGTNLTVNVRSAVCPAHALAMLASLRSPSGGPVVVAGLSGSSARVLRYLDIEVRPEGAQG